MRRLAKGMLAVACGLVIPGLALGVGTVSRTAAGASTRAAAVTGAALLPAQAASAAPGVAQGHGNPPGRERAEEHRGRKESEHARGRRERERARAFSDHDQRLIRRYFQDTSNLPPGLAKRGGNLPPGLERQLRRNGTLPPGLQKRARPFPERLSRELPPLPSGWSRVLVAGRAVIMDGNHRILDIMAIFK